MQVNHGVNRLLSKHLAEGAQHRGCTSFVDMYVEEKRRRDDLYSHCVCAARCVCCAVCAVYHVCDVCDVVVCV